MGFFKDFKRDFAQAVNELMPDKDELGAEYDDEDMVNTFDENDDMEIAPEDMLEDLDDLSIDNLSIENMQGDGQIPVEDDFGQKNIDTEYKEELDGENEGKSEFFEIPNAEIIAEEEHNNQEDDLSDMDFLNMQFKNASQPEILEAEKVEEEPAVHENISEEKEQPEALDELEAIDDLDEADMLENIEDANATEPEGKDIALEIDGMNFNQDVLEAVKREEERKASVKIESDDYEMDTMFQEDNMAEVQAKINEKEQDINSILSDDTTYITKGTTVKGDIETDGGVDIIGTVIGKVSCGGKLIIGGSIKGDIKAGEIYANAAKIEGEINADGSVKIGVGSVVVGDVSATSAVIAGAVNGDIDVHGPVIVDSTAVIMGNIKSRSVQINNGAVIEGFCSQCYSEIDVKSFFDIDEDKAKDDNQDNE